jgi:Xaa-Pro dipeptidase
LVTSSAFASLQPEQRPTIPTQQFADRLATARSLMEEMELDLIVAYADDRAVFGAAHLRWLFDYYCHFEPACALIPRNVDPVIITGAESDSYILSSSRFTGQIFTTPEFVHPDEEYPFAKVMNVSDVLTGIEKAQGCRIDRIGIAGSDLMGQRLHQTFAALFPQGRILNIGEQVDLLRSIKSEQEIDVIRYAYFLAEQGTRAAISAITEGATEREIAAEAEYVMRSLGSEGSGIDTIVASGREHTYPILHRTTTRRIRDGDAVVLTIAPRYEGYHGAIGRTLLVGQVDPIIRRARDVAADALEQTAKSLRPQATARQIDAVARSVVTRGGFGDQFLYSGSHSVGVIEFEAPILSSFSSAVVAEDMVFSIDIPMFHCPWGGLRIEEGFHVTSGAAEPLQQIPRIIEL